MPTDTPVGVNHHSPEPDKLNAKYDVCEEEKPEETVLRKEGSVAAAVDPPPDDGMASVKSVINSSGHPLDRKSRSFFEPRFGTDLSHVRIHTDSIAGQSARAINAKAYTLGSNIVFGSGEYSPDYDSGKKLLAHELAHVALQDSSSPTCIDRPSESCKVHRSVARQTPSQVPSSVETAARQPGRPLSEPLRQRAEVFFGADLGHVRIHDDPLAATAAAESRAHALAAGPHILLSRRLHDLSRTESQRTLAHELAHTLQPHSGNSSVDTFDSDASDSEVAARNAADAFLGNSAGFDASAPQPARHGVSRERDARLDDLVSLIERMPLVLSDRGIAQSLNSAVPGLNLDDQDNYAPLSLLLDEHFGPGSGERILSEWRTIQSEPALSRSAAPVTPEGRRATTPSAASAAVATRAAGGGMSVQIVSEVPPASMSGTELEIEIAMLRTDMGMPPLNEDAPASDVFEPRDSDDQLRLDRLLALEIEFYDRRRLLETMRGVTTTMAEQQRASGIGITDVLETATNVLSNPGMVSVEIASTLLGNPVEDFATGFLPGFLGGAVLELPRDAFSRLDAETREHPFLFNGGVMAGAPVGALEGLRDMVVGLAELLGLAVEFSPLGMAWHQAREAYRMITDPEGYRAEQVRQFEQARAIGETIVSLVGSMINDPAFMIAHGRELGEIAGRASGRWFNEDYMRRSTFDKGYTVGKVEGRIVFEIVALFVGPEEWIARGATAVGEVARLSGPLRRAILEFIERIPALRRLLAAGREATTAVRETAAAERALAEGGEALSDAARAGEGGADLARGSGATDEGARALEGTAEEARGGRAADEAAEPGRAATAEASALDTRDLADIGPVNDQTMQFFREHPDRLHAWADNPAAGRACKLCSSPCFPENMNASQIERLEELIQRAESQGTEIERHALHDGLESLSESDIDRFIDGFESRLDDAIADPSVNPMADLADREMLLGREEEPLIGGEPDPDVNPIDRIAGRPSEAMFSGDLGEGMEAAGAGAGRLPQTYAQRFSAATREDLRRIFTEFGDGALREFVNRLNLPPGGLRQVEIPTAAGLRRVDRLFTEGGQIVLREIKNYPRAILDHTARIAEELEKDMAILARFREARVDWHITGNISNEFLLELQMLEAEFAGRFRIIRGTPFTIVP